MPKTFALCSTSACLCLCLWVSIPRWLFSLYFSSVGFWTPRIGNKKDKALSPVQWGSCNRKSTKVHNCEIFLLQGQESLAAQPDNVLVRTLFHLKQTPLGPYMLDLLPRMHIHTRSDAHSQAIEYNFQIRKWWLGCLAARGGEKKEILPMTTGSLTYFKTFERESALIPFHDSVEQVCLSKTN